MEKINPVIGRKIDKSTLINLERGKIPPQSVDLEEVVLGAMMIDKKGVDEVIAENIRMYHFQEDWWIQEEVSVKTMALSCSAGPWPGK